MRIERRLGGRRLLPLVLLLAAGCATQAQLASQLGPQGLPTELTGTPFFPQTKYQCGPAALATALAASGVSVTPDELVDKVYIPGKHGSLQPELVAATRTYDRVAYRLDPDLRTLAIELAAGHPVLILQNRGLDMLPIWHYAVVVGLDPARDQVVLRSGKKERELMSARRFEDSWRRAQNWAVVVVDPAQPPPTAEKQRFVEAIAGLEAAKRYEAARTGYRAALQRWPHDTTAMLGLGNVSYARHQLADAEAAYRELLAVDPGHAVAHNNLASVLLEAGRPQDALQEITAARNMLADERLAPLLAATEAEIRRALNAQ